MFLSLLPEYGTPYVPFPEQASDLNVISQPSPELEVSLAVAGQGFIAQLDHHRSLIQSTWLRYYDYHENTEEKRLSRQIFDQHVRHFKETFSKFVKYLFDARGLEYCKNESRCPESTFSRLLGNLESEDYCSGITLAYRDICLELLGFEESSTTLEGTIPVPRVVDLVHNAHAISKDLAIRHWNGVSPFFLTSTEAMTIEHLHDKVQVVDFTIFKGIW